MLNEKWNSKAKALSAVMRNHCRSPVCLLDAFNASKDHAHVKKVREYERWKAVPFVDCVCGRDSYQKQMCEIATFIHTDIIKTTERFLCQDSKVTLEHTFQYVATTLG